MASVGDGNPTMSETRVVMKMNIFPDVSMKDYQYLLQKYDLEIVSSMFQKLAVLQNNL